MVAILILSRTLVAQHVESADGETAVLSFGSTDGVKNGMTGKLCTAEVVAGRTVESCSARFAVISTSANRCTVRITGGSGRDARTGYLAKFDQILKKVVRETRPRRDEKRGPSEDDKRADRAFENAARDFDAGDCRGALERYETLLQRYPKHSKADLASARAEICKGKLEQIGLPPSTPADKEGSVLVKPLAPVAPPVVIAPPPAVVEAEELAASAEKLFKDGQIPEARHAAMESLRKDSTNPRAHTISRAIAVKSVASRFNRPTDLVVAANGWCYVADSGNSTIRRIADGMTTTVAGVATLFGTTDGPSGRARFNDPTGIGIARDGALYVADRYNASIRRVATDGRVSTVAGRSGSPGDVDGSGASVRFSEPRRLAIDGDGTIYVADTANHAIRKVSPDGQVVTIARAAPNDRMDPYGVAIDPAGGIVVADAWGHVIRHIATDGTMRIVAGVVGARGANDGLTTAARFNAPEGVTVAADGTIYVSDSGNHVIRKISAGVVSTVAGRSGMSGSDDGIASSARFNDPSGLTVDSRGSVWIADRGNQTVRVFTAGVVTTVAGLSSEAGSSDGAN